MVAVLILSAGILGRVTAMHMASRMMASQPVLHRVVESREDAPGLPSRHLLPDGHRLRGQESCRRPGPVRQALRQG